MSESSAASEGIDQAARESGATEVLSVDECWHLLRDHELGRLAIAAAGEIDIFPLNYATTENTVIFRTTAGTKLVEVVIARKAAFEIDGYQPDRGQAWSVVAKGSIELLEKWEDIDQQPEVRPWNHATKDRYVQLKVTEITGRRFTVYTTRDGQRPTTGSLI